MLYFKALLEGLAEMPPADALVRHAIEAEAAARGWPHIHAQLAQVDPESAERIHPNHSQRLSRALEVYRVSGKTMTELRREQTHRHTPGFGQRYAVTQLAFMPDDRRLLHQRIAQRFAQMLEQGLIDEVTALRQRGDLHADLPAMRAVGYRQVWEYLDGRFGRDELLERGVIATRQLAKRQCTWLRGWPGAHRISPDRDGGEWRPMEEIVRYTLNFLAKGAI